MSPSMSTSRLRSTRAVARTIPLALVFLASLEARGSSPAWVQRAGPADAILQARVGGGWLSDLVPAFRASERDRLVGELQLEWTPEPLITVWTTGAVHHELAGAGPTWTGLDAVSVGTRLRPLRQPAAVVDLGLVWRATLPVSWDQGALGSDETDVVLLGELGRSLGRVRVDAAAGLAILGNPLRFANQDDVPLIWLTGRYDPGPLSTHLRIGGDVHTPRSPDRLQAVVGVETRCPLLAGAEAGAGLSPAAADWSGRAWLGWAWGCRDRPGD